MTAAALPDGAGPAPRKIGNRNYVASRPELKLAGEDEENGTRLSPTFMKEARYTRELCGMRSVASVHPLGEESGIPVCQEPPEMWARRKNGAR